MPPGDPTGSTTTSGAGPRVVGGPAGTVVAMVDVVPSPAATVDDDASGSSSGSAPSSPQATTSRAAATSQTVRLGMASHTTETER